MLGALRGKPWVIGLAALLTLVGFYVALSENSYVPSLSSSVPKLRPTNGAWEFVTERDERNLGLSDEQCQIAFPDQYVEIERARQWHQSQGGIKQDQIKLWREEPDKAHGQLRILIFDGDLYIVGEKQGVVDRTRYLNGAAMIYRAITAIPDPRVLPNVEFTLDRMDHPNPEPQRPGRTAWAWTRHLSDNNTWVMPDFNGWASSGWDTVGGYRAFREKTKQTNGPFDAKTRKLLWRGQIDVGMKVSTIRSALLEASKDQPWSDVGAFRWGGEGQPVAMEDHCKWQFLAHTEGNSWSGRLRNLVNCNSAIVIHNPLEWMAHFYPLLTPSGPKQNYIAVKNDWSDLRETMEHLLTPEGQREAARVAQNTKDTFRDRYMTPAAEACYIRRMIYEWGRVQKWDPKLFKEDGHTMRGVSWERFAWRRPKEFKQPKPPDDYFFRSDQVDFED